MSDKPQHIIAPKFYINGVLYDSEKDHITIIWPDDMSRKQTGEFITNMPDNESIRFFCLRPHIEDPEKEKAEHERTEKMFDELEKTAFA